MRPSNLIVVVLLAGCVDEYELGNAMVSSATDYGPAMRAEFRADVLAAAAVWRDALEGCADPFPASDGAEPSLEVALVAPTEWTFPPAQGFTPTDDRIYLRGPGAGAELGANTVHILVHEMGHVLGIPHSTDPTSVMSPNNTLPPNRRDVIAARAALECP